MKDVYTIVTEALLYVLEKQAGMYAELADKQ